MKIHHFALALAAILPALSHADSTGDNSTSSAVITSSVSSPDESISSASVLQSDSPLDNAQRTTYYPAPYTGRITNEKWADAVQKARDFVKQLTLAEKVNLTTGIGFGAGLCVGNTGSVPRLGFWGICLNDSPTGPDQTDFVTAFPPGIAAGATFNRTLIHERGRAIGKQYREKGIDVALGPLVGPLGVKAQAGRGWEGFGADAYLQGIAGGLTVAGQQEQGVMATAKHVIGNEQETYRMPPLSEVPLNKAISSNIDDRALHEVYGWPFMDLVHEGVVSVMCAYNEVNNTPSCQNSYILNNLLKTEYGFPGFVVSDWGATKSGVDSIISGLDLEGPGTNVLPQESNGASFFGPNVTAAVLNGTVTEDRLNDMVMRIMAGYFFVGRDVVRKDIGGPNFSTETLDTFGYEFPAAEAVFKQVNKHVNTRNRWTERVALDVALESSALVKNNDVLPVDISNVTKIGIIGAGARPPIDGGVLPGYHMGGSFTGAFPFGGRFGVLYPSNFVTPLEAINRRATDALVAIDYYVGEEAGTSLERVVANSDVNFIFGTAWASEGADRTDFDLAFNATEQILRAASLHNNNIVIITSVGQVDVEQWIDNPNITAVLFNVPQGAYGGEAIAQVLFGEYNPSGRLPFTVAKDVNDYIPIVNDTMGGSPQDNFDWGLYYDYRMFDKNEIEPRFEFGAGMSYSTFEFSNLTIQKITDVAEQLDAPPELGAVETLPSTNEAAEELVYPEGFSRVGTIVYSWLESAEDAQPGDAFSYPDGYTTDQPTSNPLSGGGVGGNPQLWDVVYHVEAQLTNKGPYSGAYVAQLYLGTPDDSTPIRQLRGFDKIWLDVDETGIVSFELRRRDLSIWDVSSRSWVVPRGQYDVYVGSSSRNLELSDSFTVS